MEIISNERYQQNLPEEKKNNYYIYMTEDPRMRPRIYVAMSPMERNLACDDLGAYNMPMIVQHILATEQEQISYTEKLRFDREKIYNEFIVEQNKRGPRG